MTRQELLPQIFKLSTPDQMIIAEAIRNHLVGGLAPLNETEFKQELERIVADADRNPQDQAPLEVVIQRLKAGL